MKSEPHDRYLPDIAKIISSFGKWYNGFESFGTENIPSKGPGLLVFYHGLMPLDAWYFGLQYYLQSGRLIRGLGDRWLFKVPGVSWLVRAVGGVEGSPEAALRLLRDGHLVGVAPGGVREAISGKKKNYELVWKNRQGFARVALEANVPLIPCFTENVEELYRAPFAESKLIQSFYEKTRWPLVPLFGLGPFPFPVKLRTYIGAPIFPNKGETAEELAVRLREKLGELIDRYQKKDKSIPSAIRDRWRY